MPIISGFSPFLGDIGHFWSPIRLLDPISDHFVFRIPDPPNSDFPNWFPFQDFPSKT
jgi:hypothetical protein